MMQRMAVIRADALYIRESLRIEEGYLRLGISIIRREESHSRRIDHPRFPLLYVPFTEEKKYHLKEEQARVLHCAVDDEGREKTSYIPFTPRISDNGFFRTAMKEVESSLDKIVRACSSLQREKEVRRRRFLAQFPREIWEYAPLRHLYGSVSPKKVKISLTEQDSRPQDGISSKQKPKLHYFVGAAGWRW